MKEYKFRTNRDLAQVNVSVFQDGYIGCDIVDSIGCQDCYKRFLERMKRE